MRSAVVPRKGCCSSKGSLVWDRRGIALVAVLWVLWVLVLLSVIAAGFLYATRTRIHWSAGAIT